MVRTFRAAALGLVATACVPRGAFQCADDTECGPPGYCEKSGYCSVDDAACESGRRYARYAPDAIAEACVPQEDVSGPASECIPAGRSASAPAILFDFCEGEGSPASLTEPVLPLALENGAEGVEFKWVADGLQVDGGMAGSTTMRSVEPVFTRLEQCAASGEVTVEAWVTPLTENQAGNTVIVEVGTSVDNAFGTDVSMRMSPEFGVPGYFVQLRTSADPENTLGTVSWMGTPLTRPSHVVFVHDAAGMDTLYHDGEVIAQAAHAGDLSVWNPNFDFVLGNDPNHSGRAFRGTYHLVAIYCEAFTSTQVGMHHDAGHRP